MVGCASIDGGPVRKKSYQKEPHIFDEGVEKI
jgi:hypothetical protein